MPAKLIRLAAVIVELPELPVLSVVRASVVGLETRLKSTPVTVTLTVVVFDMKGLVESTP